MNPPRFQSVSKTELRTVEVPPALRSEPPCELRNVLLTTDIVVSA